MSNERPLEPLAYSIAEAVQVSGFSRTFIYGEIERGKLRAGKKQGRRYILRRELEAWLEQRGE